MSSALSPILRMFRFALEFADIYIVKRAAIYLFLSLVLVPAEPEAAKVKLSFEFTRFLNKGGSETLECFCLSKKECVLEKKRNNKVVETKSVPTKTINRIISDYFSKGGVRAPAASGNDSDSRVVLTWKIYRGKKSSQGQLRKTQLDRFSGKPLFDLEAKLWLELLE